MAIKGRIKVVFDLEETGSADIAAPAAPIRRADNFLFTSGAGAGQANLAFSDRRTLGPSATEDLDLAGVLAGALGGVLTYARVKGVWVRSVAGNVNDVQVTRPANGVGLFMAVGDGIALPPGAGFLFVTPDADGVVVTPGTGDLLTVTNSGAGTSVTYDVVVLGAAS